MEKYTFEQIVNEKIREMDEIERMTNEFNELVESPGDKYNFVTARTLMSGDGIGLYSNYANEFKNFTYRFRESLLDGELLKMKLLMPPNIIMFNDVKADEIRKSESWRSTRVFYESINDMQSEYKDENGNIILIIKDVKKFKEMFHAFYESEVVKEYHRSVESETIDNNGDNVIYGLGYGYWKFYNKYSELDVINNKWIVMCGNKLNAPKLLDLYKNLEIDGSLLSDYFKENIETNKSRDCQFVFSDKYVAIPYMQGLRRWTEEGFELHKDEASKKIILTKTRQY